MAFDVCVETYTDMEVQVIANFCGLIFGVIPLLAIAIWHWNDFRFCATLRLRYFWNGGGRRPKLPPGHMGLPFVGEMFNFLWYFKVLGRPDDFINSKKHRHGEGLGIYRSHLFGSPSIITCTVASNKFILQSHEDFTIAWPAAELVGKKSLVNLEGKQYTVLKKFLVNAINHPGALRRILQVVQPRVIPLLTSWADKGTVNVYSEMKKVTFENICKIFVSMDPGPLLEETSKLFAGIVPGFRAYPIDFPGTAFHHARRCRRKLEQMFMGELEKRRMNDGDYSDDLMDRLMKTKNEEGKQLSDEEVVHNIVSFVIGGYESTTLASMWALYHISKSPEILRKLRVLFIKEESETIRKGGDGFFITLEDVSKMKYMAKVVEETLRIANISLNVFRVATKDVDFGEYTIPKGYQVLAWLRSAQTDENNFENPMSFIPERWERSAKPVVHQAFGVGSRLCAGNMLARLQITILLHHLVIGYKWELVNPDAKIKYLPHPKPVDGATMTFSTIH